MVGLLTGIVAVYPTGKYVFCSIHIGIDGKAAGFTYKPRLSDSIFSIHISASAASLACVFWIDFDEIVVGFVCKEIEKETPAIL